MQAETAIRKIVARIARQFHPEKIVLFGSHARGAAGPDSDVDLLVVMPVHGSRRQQATTIDKALWGIDVPVDIVVATPEQVDLGKERIGSFICPALKDGKVVYEGS